LPDLHLGFVVQQQVAHSLALLVQVALELLPELEQAPQRVLLDLPAEDSVGDLV
jgi:hypothetical protein